MTAPQTLSAQVKAAMAAPAAIPSPVGEASAAYAALARLLTVALTDTGQGRRCANFVLAWWNAGRDGGFDLTDLFNVDRTIAADMATVFAYVARANFCFYPTEYEAEIAEVIALHRGRRRRGAA